MSDVLCIGSALVDIFITSDSFVVQKDVREPLLCAVYGDKTDVESFQAYVGGGACNTAIGFTKAGFSTTIISELGTDMWSDLISSELRRQKVDTNLLITEKKEQTGGSIILLSSDGGRSILVYRGAASLLDPQDVPELAFTQTSWVHLSSISGRLTTLQKIFTQLSQNKLRFSWNPGKAEIQLLVSGELKIKGLRCSVLFVNQEEWNLLEPVQETLHQFADHIVITNGPQGGTVYAGGEPVHQYHAVPTKAVNETGSGDSFVVGFVSALLMGNDLRTAVNWGKHNAAAKVQTMGAVNGLLTRDQLLQLEAV